MFVKVKVSELSGPALDWAVAQCVFWDYVHKDVHYSNGVRYLRDKNKRAGPNFSTSKSFGGKMIQRYGISTAIHSDDTNLMFKAWFGEPWEEAKTYSYGQTALIAAMRRLVEDWAFIPKISGDDFSGSTIQVPVELVGKA
jgi:hypothetical protein